MRWGWQSKQFKRPGFFPVLGALAFAENLLAEAIDQIRSDASHELKLLPQHLQSHPPAGVRDADTCSHDRRYRLVLVDVRGDVAGSRVDIPAVADHRRQVRAEIYGQVVDPLGDGFRAGQQRFGEALNCVFTARQSLTLLGSSVGNASSSAA